RSTAAPSDRPAPGSAAAAPGRSRRPAHRARARPGRTRLHAASRGTAPPAPGCTPLPACPCLASSRLLSRCPTVPRGRGSTPRATAAPLAPGGGTRPGPPVPALRSPTRRQQLEKNRERAPGGRVNREGPIGRNQEKPGYGSMKQTLEARGAPRAVPARDRAESYRPPYLAAALAALAVFTLYAVTLARTTQFWDTSEYIATAHIMGIPHPPGNPLFVVLARAWELLLAPTGLSVAVRINLFSATMSALAHGFWFLLMHRVAAFMTGNRTVQLVAASAAVLVSATAFTVWNQSNVNEKVYTVSLFTIAFLSWLAFRWRDNLGRGKDDNLILLMIFVLALSVGNHLMAFLVAPSLALFIIMVAPRTLLNWRLYAAGALVAALGLSIHLFLPLRASLDPIINEAHPSTWTALVESLTRKQYDKPSMFSDPTNPGMPRTLPLLIAQIGNYLQYFDWQWARSVAGPIPLFGGLRWVFTLLFIGLGSYGAWEHYRKDRTSWA